MPIAATSHSVAAVVNPRIEKPWRMIAPAPRKPMPLTICAAMRVGSIRPAAPPWRRNSWKPYAETIVKSAEPTETSMCVRRPAPRSRSSRSNPIAPPSAAATPRRSTRSPQPSVGTAALSKWRSRELELQLRDPADPERRKVDQLVEQLARERVPLRRRLHLDEPAVAGHDDVHVGLRRRVLGVVEVEERRAVDDADGDRGDRVAERFREAEALERSTAGDVGAADRRAARAAVGLEDVAVEPERPRAERLEIDDRANRTADQPLDLDGAPSLLPARGLPLGPVAGRGGQERVLGGQPAAPGAVEPARHALLHRRRAEHLRLPLRPENGSVRLLEVVDLHVERSQVVGAPAVVSSIHAVCSSKGPLRVHTGASDEPARPP